MFSKQDKKTSLRERSKSLPQSCQPNHGITCSNQDLRTLVTSSEETKAAQRRKSFAAIQKKSIQFSGYHYEPTKR